MIFELDPSDQELAVTTAKAVLATVETVKQRDRKLDHTRPGRSLDREIAWIGAEIAYARALGEEWVPRTRRWTGGDIVTRAGEILEIRHRTEDGRGMPLFAWDELDRYYFLAVRPFPCYRLAGWLPGRIADLRATVPSNGWRGDGRVVEQPRLWTVEGWIRGYPVTGPAARRPRPSDAPDVPDGRSVAGGPAADTGRMSASRGPLDDELDRVAPDWRPCPFGCSTDDVDCPRCHGEGRIDVNPATAAIPF